MISVCIGFNKFKKDDKEIIILNVINKYSSDETISGQTELKSETYFLNPKKFFDFYVSVGEVLDIKWGRNHKGFAVPLMITRCGFEPNICEFYTCDVESKTLAF